MILPDFSISDVPGAISSIRASFFKSWNNGKADRDAALEIYWSGLTVTGFTFIVVAIGNAVVNSRYSGLLAVFVFLAVGTVTRMVKVAPHGMPTLQEVTHGEALWRRVLRAYGDDAGPGSGLEEGAVNDGCVANEIV